MESLGAKITDETGAVWDLRIDRQPRCAVETAGPTFLRFAPRELCADKDDSGTAGASDFLVDQRHTVWSADADSIRLEG